MSDDLISRQAAIDALNKKKIYRPLDSDRYVISDCLNAIVNLQSAQKWIPVTERLPERGEKVLVSTEETVFVQVFNGIYRTPNRWAWEHATIKKVTAWMPLPNPWKGESDGIRKPD